jgi:hypothetical protein
MRMDQTSVKQKLSESKPEGGLNMESSRLRLIEDVENDFKEIRIKRWRQNISDREEWASVVMEAKVLKRSQSQ